MNLTLKEVSGQYNQWRMQTGARGRVPDHLRNQALSLTERHTNKVVSDALGITSKSIQNWKNKKCTESADFIPLKVHNQVTLPEVKIGTITMVLPGELRLLLDGLSSAHAVELISTLSKALVK